MKERPIIFTGESVRAILDGRKTQTRRVVNDAPADWMGYTFHRMVGQIAQWTARVPGGLHSAYSHQETTCPYGKPGDRLWVRESFQPIDHPQMKTPFLYKADMKGAYRGWKPSIHMPRAASRITLEITGVRVERLQDISEEDAKAEGVKPIWVEDGDNLIPPHDSYREGFAELWDKINGKKHPWARNPWVWCIEFKQI